MEEQKIKQNKHQINSSKKGKRIIKELEDGLDPVVLGRQILIKGENKRIFNDYVLKIRERIGTQSKIEEEFLNTYIFSGWKLRRFREIEKNLLNSQQQKPQEESFGSLDVSGEYKSKRRVRNISKIEITDEIKENNLTQEKLKKEMVKALRQLREEQNFNMSKKEIN
jgi:hypothetical protein